MPSAVLFMGFLEEDDKTELAWKGSGGGGGFMLTYFKLHIEDHRERVKGEKHLQWKMALWGLVAGRREGLPARVHQ